MTAFPAGTSAMTCASGAGMVAVHSGRPVAAEMASTLAPSIPSSVPPSNVTPPHGAPCQSACAVPPVTAGSRPGAAGAGVVTVTPAGTDGAAGADGAGGRGVGV